MTYYRAVCAADSTEFNRALPRQQPPSTSIQMCSQSSSCLFVLTARKKKAVVCRRMVFLYIVAPPTTGLACIPQHVQSFLQICVHGYSLSKRCRLNADILYNAKEKQKSFLARPLTRNFMKLGDLAISIHTKTGSVLHKTICLRESVCSCRLSTTIH